MLTDYHVHTSFSHDSTYPLSDVARDAANLHLDEICITDHVDYGVMCDWDGKKPVPYHNGKPFVNVDYPRYVEEIDKIRQLYDGTIQVRLGLEFGVQTHTISDFEALFRHYPFDFIILSIHQVEDKQFFTQEFQEGRTQKEYNERYYQEMLNVVERFQNYSVLGHMDLIERYDPAGIYPFAKVKDFIAEILKIVIAQGKGLELNTSTHRYGLPKTMPSREIWELYKDLGGNILTIGSDSHAPAHLGTYLTEGQAFLRNLGFRHVCTFDRMQPFYHAL